MFYVVTSNNMFHHTNILYWFRVIEYSKLSIIIMLSLRSAMAKLGLKCGSAQDTSKKRRVKKMVPTGYFPVYVGDDEKVYVIPIKILSETLFKALLNQFKDENTTLVNKPITIGCTSQFFEEILNAVNCKYKVIL